MGRPLLEDLTGRCFGHLRVLGRAPAPKPKASASWRCLCDRDLGGCGAEKDIPGGCLRSGRSRSCGCLRRRVSRQACKMRAKPKYDLTGCRFGRSLVIGLAPEPDAGMRRWIVRCDCGRETHLKSQDIRSTKGLGCPTCAARVRRGKSRLDLVGWRSGMLTVIAPASPRGRQAWWLCRCDCSGETILPTGRLTTGATGSCGCAVREGKTVRPESLRRKAARAAQVKRKTDAAFAINCRMRCRIRESLAGCGIRKSRRWEELVGYTLDDLRAHLETTLPAGSTWADFLQGDLEIDHVVGLEHFRFENEDDPAFRVAWALGNLQFLTKPKHREKSKEANRRRARERLTSPQVPAPSPA
jgi:hypothetical protein